jgi:hypothetical protein
VLAEHVAAQDPRAKVVESALGDVVVDASLAARFSVHLTPDARVKEPFHEVGSVDAERVLEILPWAGTVAVE